jgi:FKBP-type peptidyl-prolyl cis-trans isomerase (trigger factor)
MKTKKEKRENAEVSITGTLPKEDIEPATEKTLLKIQKELHLPGFRKGTAPLGNVRSYVGEAALWKEAAEGALRDSLESILKENEVIPIFPVSASLVSAQPGEDMSFEIVAVVAPTCSIEGYKETAEKALKKLPELDVAKEKEQALAAFRAQTRQMTQASGDGPLSDEEAKKIGFENTTALELFMNEEAEHSIKEKDVQRKRSAIAEALIEKAACDLPTALIHEEAGRLLETMKRDVAGQGMPFNEYLKHRNKSEPEVLAELEVPAEKRVCLDLVFAEIARAEKLTADEKEEERLAHALVSQGVDHETAHRYVRATVMREKVWELLGTPAVSKQPAEPAEEKN